MFVEAFTKLLEDLLLASAKAEGDAAQKDVTNQAGLDACEEGCFAVDPALPLLNRGSA